MLGIRVPHIGTDDPLGEFTSFPGLRVCPRHGGAHFHDGVPGSASSDAWRKMYLHHIQEMNPPNLQQNDVTPTECLRTFKSMMM